MREVRLRYRVHMTCLETGAQWYLGTRMSPNREHGALYEDKENVEEATVAFNESNQRYLATVEEYEIPPVNEEN